MTGRLLTADEVAELLGLFDAHGRPRARWVMDQARAGRLPCVRVGRFTRFERDVIEAWWKARRRGPIYLT